MNYQIGDVIHVIQQERAPGITSIEHAQIVGVDIDNNEYCLHIAYVTHQHPRSSIKQVAKWYKAADLDRLVNEGVLYRGTQAFAFIDDVLQPFDWTTMRTVVDYAGMMVAKKYVSNDQLSIDQTWNGMIDGCESLMSGNMQGVIDHNIELLGGCDEEDDDDYATCNCVECDEPGDINDMASTPCGSVHEECLADHCSHCGVCQIEFSDELEAGYEEDDEADDA